MNKLVGVVACGRVDRLAVDVHDFIGNYGRAAVAGISHTVEHSAQHIFGHRKRQASSKKSCFGSGDFESLSVFKQLHYRFVVLYFQHFTTADFAVFLNYFDKLVVFDAFDALYKHERSDNFFNGFIFLIHRFLLSWQAP